MLLLVIQIFNKQEPREPERDYSEFSEALERGDIAQVMIQGRVLHGTFQNGDRFRTYEPGDTELVRRLRDKGVKIQAKPEDGASVFKMCRACHDSERNAPARIGTSLWGIVNQRKAARPGFNYSTALRAKGGIWSYRDLADYLNNPRKFAPGTSMTFAGIVSNRRMADLLAYLRTLSDNPAPLPN